MRSGAALHLASLLLLIISVIGRDLTCRNSSGGAVDWWVALKLPFGKKYLYLDSDPFSGPLEWQYHQDIAGVHDNPLAETLQQVYDATDAGRVMWNDELPNGTVSFTLAHAKGVLGYGETGRGFWLVHSAPRFPDSPDVSAYQGVCCDQHGGQLLNGQSFLCVTLGADALSAAARLLHTPHVFIYDAAVPNALAPLLALRDRPGGNVSASKAKGGADGGTTGADTLSLGGANDGSNRGAGGVSHVGSTAAEGSRSASAAVRGREERDNKWAAGVQVARAMTQLVASVGADEVLSSEPGASGKDLAHQAMRSAGGEPFDAFAKATTPGRALYLWEDTAAPFYATGLEVQSWLRGEGALPSYCPPADAPAAFPVTNIRALAASVARRWWNATTDHSKWAIAAPPAWSRAAAQGNLTAKSSGESPSGDSVIGLRDGGGALGRQGPGVGASRGGAGGGYAYGDFYGAACVGDLNRERGQLVRGGSALCFSGNPGVWRAFRRLVASVEACGP